MEQKVDEKRRFHRVLHSKPVHFQFKDPTLFGGCLSSDLSERGVRVRLNDFVPLNTELALTIKLADENVIECTGRIVWIEKARFGDYYYAGLEFPQSDLAVGSQKKFYGFLSHPDNPPSSSPDEAGAQREDAQAKPRF